MPKPFKTEKEEVVSALLTNLKALTRYIPWSAQHELVKSYIVKMDDPQRLHYTWRYVRGMLQELTDFQRDLAKEFLKNPSESPYSPQQFLRLRAAILFHRSVWVPGGPNNEELSSMFATQFYTGTNIAEISNMIVVTRHQFPFLSWLDERDIMCDLDLASIGAGSNEFEQYRLAIAQEQSVCADPSVVEKKTRDFFLSLREQAKRDRIYRTTYFRAKYEDQARRNIQMVLSGFGL